LLDWFYLHCADHHVALQTKKGMIDVTRWTMFYILGDPLDWTLSNEILRQQFCQDLITEHKCTGAQALYNSGKYIDPILRELQNLRVDPDFTLKELYRHHNFAEINIGKRKAAKIKDGPPIAADDATESTHSSSSNTLDVPERAHVDEGIGSFSALLNWFYTHRAGHHESLQTPCSMLQIASWAMQEVKTLFIQDNAKKTCAISFPRMLLHRHKRKADNQFILDFTRPICTRMLDLQDDVGFTQEELSPRHEFAQRSIAAMTHSSPTNQLSPTNRGRPNISSAVASPSTQTVNTTATTPPIRNVLKHDIAQSTPMNKSITELQAPEQSAEESSIATNDDGDSSNTQPSRCVGDVS
jgi:hypothetical protein